MSVFNQKLSVQSIFYLCFQYAAELLKCYENISILYFFLEVSFNVKEYRSVIHCPFANCLLSILH